MATRPVTKCFEVTRMFGPCAKSLVLPCHSLFQDDAQHVLSTPHSGVVGGGVRYHSVSVAAKHIF